MLARMLEEMFVLIDDLFVHGPPMISDRGDLLALQNGVLERKKVPPSANGIFVCLPFSTLAPKIKKTVKKQCCQGDEFEMS